MDQNRDARHLLNDVVLQRRRRMLISEEYRRKTSKKMKRSAQLDPPPVEPPKFNAKSLIEICGEILFNSGHNPDVTLVLDKEGSQLKELMLHKRVLSQKSYFQSLFASYWTEASRNIIEIKVIDDNISERSLDITFKSLYNGQLAHDKTEEDFISLLATARMFSLDEIANNISSQMTERVVLENAIDFYYSFISYGFGEYANELFQWILMNFSYWYQAQSTSFCSEVLPRLDAALLEKIITNENFIVQDEFVLYKILKEWMQKQIDMKESSALFKIWRRCTPILDTEAGSNFERIFSVLNLRYLVTDENIQSLKDDQILTAPGLRISLNENKDMIHLARKKDIHDESFRFGIVHDNTSYYFECRNVDYFGFRLKFGWESHRKTLTVTWVESEDDPFYKTASVTIRFRVVFYATNKFRNDKPYQTFDWSEHIIRKHQQVDICSWNLPDDCSSGDTNQSALDKKSLMPDLENLIQNQERKLPRSFPNVIGVETMLIR